MEENEVRVKILGNKLEEYAKENEVVFTDDQKEKVIGFLMDGKHFDFSGVTAIRGFVYQYYVAVDYIVDMLCSPTAWWTEVIFELLDDIALYGNKKLRFVQVKTVRDSDLANNLTPGMLTERTKSKGSWLDKLFLLNVYVYNQEQKQLSRNDDLMNDLELQFEVATNYRYNEDVAVYSKDELFKNENQDEDKHEKFRDNLLAKNLKWTVTYNGNEVTYTADYYDDSVHTPEWYLERFRVERFGEFEYLEERIIKKITSKTPGNRDEFHDLKSKYIFKDIVNLIVNRTCQDRMDGDFERFVFRKEELEPQFQQWVDIAAHRAREAAGRDDLGTVFIRSFNSVRRDIETSSFQPHLKHELIQKLDSVQTALAKHIDNQIDPRVYARFVQRLFHRLDSHNPIPLDNNDETRLSGALKHLIFCLVFYPEMEYSFDKALLLFKHGRTGETSRKTFSIYSTRGDQDFDLAKRNVRNTAATCEVSQGLRYDYHCIIADCKEEAITRRVVSTKQREISVLKSVAEPSQELLGESITKRTENIRFHKDSFVKGYWSALESDDSIDSFQVEDIVQEWHELLEEDHSKQTEG